MTKRTKGLRCITRIVTRGEDDAREAAIAQRLRWEQEMERAEKNRLPKVA